MKKFLLVLALSAVAGVANASKIEIVNKTKHEQRGALKIIGVRNCDKHVFALSLQPGESKTFNALNCCALWINIFKVGVWGKEDGPEWRPVGEIRFCGAREKFEIRPGEKSNKVTIENVTGK